MLPNQRERLATHDEALRLSAEFAERFPSEDEMVNGVGQFKSWPGIVKALPLS